MDGLCSQLLANLDAKDIFYFSSDKLKSTEPHYFICISTSDPDGLIGMVCCTSQFAKRQAFINDNNISYQTLVRIKKSNDNGLKKESYVDCNNYFQFTKQELINKCKTNNFQMAGTLEEAYFEQLIIGLGESKLIEGNIREYATNLYIKRYFL